MKVDEELDALTTMGLPPVRFLVMPRVVAAVLAMPVLTIFAELAGLIGGAIVLSMMDVPTPVFWRHVADVSTVFTISFGIVKGAFFGALVGLVGCAASSRGCFFLTPSEQIGKCHCVILLRFRQSAYRSLQLQLYG